MSHKTAHHGHARIIDLGPQARAIVEKFLKRDTQAYFFNPAEAAAERRRVRHEQRHTPLSCGNVIGSNRKRRSRHCPTDHYNVTTYRRAIRRACERAFPAPDHLARKRVQANGRKVKAKRWETWTEWRARLGAEKWAELCAWQKAHRFHPHQLRHTAATRWRAEFGAETTLVLLGDRTTRMVDVYAEKDRATASQDHGENRIIHEHRDAGLIPRMRLGWCRLPQRRCHPCLTRKLRHKCSRQSTR